MCQRFFLTGWARPYTVDVESSAEQVVAVVDGRRYPMTRQSAHWWSVNVELHDGSHVHFESAADRTDVQVVKLVPREVR